MAPRNEVFEFLDNLRASGKVNMMEAPRHLEAAFQYTPEEAKMNFFQWTQHLQRDADAQAKTKPASSWGAAQKEVQEKDTSN